MGNRHGHRKNSVKIESEVTTTIEERRILLIAKCADRIPVNLATLNDHTLNVVYELMINRNVEHEEQDVTDFECMRVYAYYYFTIREHDKSIHYYEKLVDSSSCVINDIYNLGYLHYVHRNNYTLGTELLAQAWIIGDARVKEAVVKLFLQLPTIHSLRFGIKYQMDSLILNFITNLDLRRNTTVQIDRLSHCLLSVDLTREKLSSIPPLYTILKSTYLDRLLRDLSVRDSYLSPEYFTYDLRQHLKRYF